MAFSSCSSSGRSIVTEADFRVFEIVTRTLQAIIVPIIGYGIFILRGIHHELRRLNGRMIAMEQWRLDHEASDTRLHNEVIERIRYFQRHGD